MPEEVPSWKEKDVPGWLWKQPQQGTGKCVSKHGHSRLSGGAQRVWGTEPTPWGEEQGGGLAGLAAAQGQSQETLVPPHGRLGLPQASGDLFITHMCRPPYPPPRPSMPAPAGQLWTIRAKALGPGMGMEQVGR